MKDNRSMFFRRVRPKQLTFRERLEALRKSGFAVDAPDGTRVRLVKGNCAADLEDVSGGIPRIGKAGVLVRGEVGALVDGGFQKFLQTPDGKRTPALAADLRALHEFEEDLRDTLGEESLYNESLGTTCNYHVYDRLKGRG